MPLFFSILGIGIVYVAALPLIQTVSALSKLVISSEVPTFNQEDTLTSIFEAPVNSAENGTIAASSFSMPSVGIHYGNISCERIGLDAPLYFGDSSTILKNGVGQYTGSHIPGSNGPILLAAHNTTFFLPLQNVENGDIITITTNYGTFEYSVTGYKVYDKRDKSAYNLSQNNEQLIMYTCYPFNMLGSLDDRFFVYADKISGPEIDYAR